MGSNGYSFRGLRVFGFTLHSTVHMPMYTPKVTSAFFIETVIVGGNDGEEVTKRATQSLVNDIYRWKKTVYV